MSQRSPESGALSKYLRRICPSWPHGLPGSFSEGRGVEYRGCDINWLIRAKAEMIDRFGSREERDGDDVVVVLGGKGKERLWRVARKKG